MYLILNLIKMAKVALATNHERKKEDSAFLICIFFAILPQTSTELLRARFGTLSIGRLIE